MQSKENSSQPSLLYILVVGFGGVDFKTLGLPTKEEYVREYMDFVGDASSPNIDFYLTFVCFRIAAILQGVYKRFTQGRGQ